MRVSFLRSLSCELEWEKLKQEFKPDPYKLMGVLNDIGGEILADKGEYIDTLLRQF